MLVGKGLDLRFHEMIVVGQNPFASRALAGQPHKGARLSLRQRCVLPDQNAALQVQNGVTLLVGRHHFFDNNSSKASL